MNKQEEMTADTIQIMSLTVMRKHSEPAGLVVLIGLRAVLREWQLPVQRVGF